MEGFSVEDDSVAAEQPIRLASCQDFWLVLTVGAQGAGKQHVIEKLIEQGRLPLINPVIVDMDGIRRRLPEYTWFLEQVPDRLDELTKAECGYISETLTHAALQQGRNVIFDSFLLDGQWYNEFIDSVRKEHSTQVKIAMIRIDASMDTILQRVQIVAEETGRSLSKNTIKYQLDALNRSIDSVRPAVDQYFEIQNDGDEIVLQSASWLQLTEAFSPIEIPKPPPLDKPPSGRRNRSRKSRRGSFVALLSTEENYRLEALEFRGAFADIRKTLDYASAGWSETAGWLWRYVSDF